MKEIVQHPIYGEIIYNENFWTGKKKIAVNGVDAQPISKKEYMVNEKRALLTGNFLTGSTLHIAGEAIQLSPKIKWYEIILAIFPVVGGALGGALGGVGAIVSMYFMKNKKPLVKALIGIIVAASTILIAFILALALLSII